MEFDLFSNVTSEVLFLSQLGICGVGGVAGVESFEQETSERRIKIKAVKLIALFIWASYC